MASVQDMKGEAPLDLTRGALITFKWDAIALTKWITRFDRKR